MVSFRVCDRVCFYVRVRVYTNVCHYSVRVNKLGGGETNKNTRLVL